MYFQCVFSLLLSVQCIYYTSTQKKIIDQSLRRCLLDPKLSVSLGSTLTLVLCCAVRYCAVLYCAMYVTDNYRNVMAKFIQYASTGLYTIYWFFGHFQCVCVCFLIVFYIVLALNLCTVWLPFSFISLLFFILFSFIYFVWYLFQMFCARMNKGTDFCLANDSKRIQYN